MPLNIVADESLDYRIVKRLRHNGFEVDSILEQVPGITDIEVMEYAFERNSILITEDSDFGEWVFVHKTRNKGIIFLRYHVKDIESISDSLLQVLNRYKERIFYKFVVISVKKIRIRESI